MAARSNHTKKLVKVLWVVRAMHWMCLAAPVGFYFVYALFAGDTPLSGRLALSASLVVVLILTFLNAVAKLRLRSPLWIFMIGLYMAIRDKLLPLIIILAVTSVIDDFILCPLLKSYTIKVNASKDLDERLDEERQQNQPEETQP